jgi:flagellar motility protein MotE (MotC chaperone)
VKKLIIACQIVFVLFFLVKALSHIDLLKQIPFPASLSWNSGDEAIAQTPAKAAPPPAKDVTDDDLQKERDLLTMLQKKQKDLEARENALKAEEQKIAALKKEVMEKIDALKALETQLTAKLDTEKAQDEKRFKDLAKVYEATPPQKAAAMLEKLDVRTAAGITINMKRDRAGLIWGFLAPQKAVEITNEITKSTRRAAE